MTEVVVPFTVAELRAIYARIELINQHFAACCAFSQYETCKYEAEYNGLYDRLRMAGLPEEKCPIDPEPFEEWLRAYAAQGQ